MMTTPADEMEQIIKEIAVYGKIDVKNFYSIKSFPEICFLKSMFYYKAEIFHDHCQNADIIERFVELRDEIESRKITIENQIVDANRKILFHMKDDQKFVPIYYKDCRFTSSYIVIDEYCENCIVEKD